MTIKTMASAFAVAASAALVAPQAGAATYDIVTDGSATITFTADFASYYLGTNWTADANGNPTRTLTARASGVDATTGVPTGTGSQAIAGGANLSLRSSVYLYPTDAAGEEVDDFATVYAFRFNETDPSVTDEMKAINYVPTSDPNVYEDYENPGTTYTLTDEQIALLNAGELRLCCRHTLGSFTLNTAEGYVDGVIDSITERDINFDGVYDSSDYFHLFTLEDSGTEGLFNLVLTEVMASYLNYGFTPQAFLDGDELAARWGWYTSGNVGLLGFAEGDVIGTISYAYTLGTTTAVPVPAALPLLAGGLGVMGVIRARRRKAAN